MVTGVKKSILYRIRSYRSSWGHLAWVCIPLHMPYRGCGRTPEEAFKMCQLFNGIRNDL